MGNQYSKRDLVWTQTAGSQTRTPVLLNGRTEREKERQKETEWVGERLLLAGKGGHYTLLWRCMSFISVSSLWKKVSSQRQRFSLKQANIVKQLYFQ